VRSLAEASGFDLEDVIIELVRSGISYAVDPKAVIRHEHERTALSSLGLSPTSDQRKKSYWQKERFSSRILIAELILGQPPGKLRSIAT
jgi:hypothetical protein